jgi:hypothetical protein
MYKSRCSSVSIGTKLPTAVQFPAGDMMTFLSSPPALGPTQPLSNGYRGETGGGSSYPLSREADRSSPSGAEVKNAWSYTSTTAIYPHGVVLSSGTTQHVLSALIIGAIQSQDSTVTSGLVPVFCKSTEIFFACC